MNISFPLGQSSTNVLKGVQKGVHSNTQSLIAPKDSFEQISKTIDRLLQGRGSVDPAELLKIQLQSHRYQIHIELVSKAAEAVLGTVRKLHQGG